VTNPGTTLESIDQKSKEFSENRNAKQSRFLKVHKTHENLNVLDVPKFPKNSNKKRF
jgi:hypothetical protein